MNEYVKLIEEQIKYWTRLQNEENSTHSIDMSIASAEECQHESDGIEYVMSDDVGSFKMNLCKLCGEFYR